MPDERKQHITEALGGNLIPPMTHEERKERERVFNMIQGVATRYNSLVNLETDEERRADLIAQRAHYDEEFRRQNSMSAAERQEVLRTYPEILAQLRAQLGE
ncbi:hypothetical protein ACFV9C_23830 [Kribbella sp. NPDC059898]|uniref:hypothetical protein n=1 Tax=Kribbella sp. NPDC059898 TaxID=3346995 RepID=UPI00365FECA0